MREKMSYLKFNRQIKVVVSGVSFAGTTTIADMLIHGTLPPNWKTYHATIRYNHYQKDFSGNNQKKYHFHLFDLGGQSGYLDNFTGELSEFIFSGVDGLIFVIDSSQPTFFANVLRYFDLEKNCLKRYSPTSSIFVLQHKADLIPKVDQQKTRELIQDILIQGKSPNIAYAETSIHFPSLPTVLDQILEKIFETFKLKQENLGQPIVESITDLIQAYRNGVVKGKS